MNKVSNFFMAIVILFTIMACNKTLKPNEYVLWASDVENGLRITKDIFPYQFVLQYKSPEYIKAMSTNNQVLLPEVSEQQLMFNLTIKSLNDKSNPVMANDEVQNRFEIIERFNNNGYEDFRLIIGNDTLNCSFCHLEHNYGVAPLNTIVLSFDVPKKSKEYYGYDWIFIYDDKVFNTGRISMKLKSEYLTKLNTIKLI